MLGCSLVTLHVLRDTEVWGLKACLLCLCQISLDNYISLNFRILSYQFL